MKRSEIFREGLEQVINGKRRQRRLTGWFVLQELKMKAREARRAEGFDPDEPAESAEVLRDCARRLPLSIPRGAVLAGTQDDAFSPSYALINPAFRVETFAGYCDPLAVYDDIEPDETFTRERIEKVRGYYAGTPYVKRLKEVYRQAGARAEEVVFFVEPVTGHVIPDVRPVLRDGVAAFRADQPDLTDYSRVMKTALDVPLILAERYAALAESLLDERADDPAETFRLRTIIENCRRVPLRGAENLGQALQCVALLWQAMCLEQAPNPYAFSIGNLDRILQPYLKDTPADEATELVRHFLAFLMVGEKCWAISQNVMVGGRDRDGNDLSCPMTDIVLDAFFASNNPQPALSVKLHSGTPEKLYASLGRFFFTPGHSTPSLFNDDMVFNVLRNKGVAEEDLADYAIAGCQEPLIMGQENGNTTNSWLNLAKVLELTLHDGRSALSGKKLGRSWTELGYPDAAAILEDLENAFYRQLDFILEKTREAANGCQEALALVGAPITSVLSGCLQTGRDARQADNPGTKYAGSGCLIHGLTVVADSFEAVEAYRAGKIDSADALLVALRDDFQGHERIRAFLAARDKFGNRRAKVDETTRRVAEEVSDRVGRLRGPAGKPFYPDFSTPSTHFLYGYHVGATPDGRSVRAPLGYGVDPIPGRSEKGLQDRTLSQKKLPFAKFTGGYASHIGLPPEDFAAFASLPEKGLAMADRIVKPLFEFDSETKVANVPFYVYFNVDSASRLRQVLEKPEVYAPNGIYIARVHGTFVNFLDLSPAVQRDIMERLSA